MKEFNFSEKEVEYLFEKVIEDIKEVGYHKERKTVIISKKKIGIVRYFLFERIKEIKRERRKKK